MLAACVLAATGASTSAQDIPPHPDALTFAPLAYTPPKPADHRVALPNGMVLFVAFGVGVIFFTGTVNAVANIPGIYLDYARTLGANRLQIYRAVIVPAMFPELRSSILLGLGVAWTAVVGAEFLGAQTGLGQIIVYSRVLSESRFGGGAASTGAPDWRSLAASRRPPPPAAGLP